MTRQGNEKMQAVLRNDLILIGVLVVVAVLALLCIHFFQTEGKQVTVSIGGEHYTTYSLDADGRFELSTGADRTHRNVLVIADGVAWVEEADCPDLICVHHRPISKKGDTIVCIPNQTVVAI